MSKRVELQLEGITCAHCAKGIEDHLREIGLADARVNFSSKTASFSETPKLATQQVVAVLAKIGFKALADDHQTNKISFLKSLEALTIFCVALTLPLILAEIFHIQSLHQPLVQLALTFPVMLTGGVYFAKSALRSLRLKKPNMDVLIALGTWAAFFYSLAGTAFDLGPQFLFYESSASIVAIVLLGNLIEERAVRKTELSLTRLQKLRPDSIRVRNKGTSEIASLPLDQVEENYEIVLSPGDRIPCDGIVIEGFAQLDESFLTGESLPRSVKLQDAVTSGSSVVEGNLIIRATAVGENSSLVKIIRTIQEARSAKPSLERLADRLTSYFVPVVLSFAAITFLANLAFGVSAADSLLRAIAVLVISCPCALGLATPTAVTVSLGLASKLGILVRKASVFEALPTVKYFFFDKTGTLTDGQFKVGKFESFTNDPNKMKQIIAGLEAFSHHPIAQALREYCKETQPAVLNEIDERRGIGVFGKSLGGRKYELSSREVPHPFHLALRENETIIAAIQLADSLRANAPLVIKSLRERYLGIEILSGDSHERTQQIASELQIDNFKAKLLPQDKSDIVAQKEKVLPVAFVGDGINDAAALSRANVGITFGAASDLARQSADVTIVSGGLERIVQLRQLSEKTISLIKQNLFWAFFYNVLCIPLAAIGLLSPMHAAFAMVLSDLIVVANSLRLKLWQPKHL